MIVELDGSIEVTVPEYVVVFSVVTSLCSSCALAIGTPTSAPTSAAAAKPLTMEYRFISIPPVDGCASRGGEFHRVSPGYSERQHDTLRIVAARPQRFDAVAP